MSVLCQALARVDDQVLQRGGIRVLAALAHADAAAAHVGLLALKTKHVHGGLLVDLDLGWGSSWDMGMPRPWAQPRIMVSNILKRAVALTAWGTSAGIITT